MIRILPEPYISAMNLFICLFVTDFVPELTQKYGIIYVPPRIFMPFLLSLRLYIISATVDNILEEKKHAITYRISMAEYNTILSAYTKYRHLG